MHELKDYFNLRKNIYSFLSKGFYKEPTSEYIDEMKKYSTVFKEMSVHYNVEDLSKGTVIFEAFHTTGKDIEGLAREYALLFLSTGITEGIQSVVPQESVYLSPAGLTMQEQRDEVCEVYYSHGVGRNDNFKEPEDHISAELSFMAQMPTNMFDNIQDTKEYIKVQRDFLENHLLKWALKACDDVYNIGSSYYKALSLFTKGFLMSDKIFLDALME